MSYNKYPGPDEIMVEMIKVGKKELNKHITVLFNLCLDKEKVPLDWKRGKVR